MHKRNKQGTYHSFYWIKIPPKIPENVTELRISGSFALTQHYVKVRSSKNFTPSPPPSMAECLAACASSTQVTAPVAWYYNGILKIKTGHAEQKGDTHALPYYICGRKYWDFQPTRELLVLSNFSCIILLGFGYGSACMCGRGRRGRISVKPKSELDKTGLLCNLQ